MIRFRSYQMPSNCRPINIGANCFAMPQEMSYTCKTTFCACSSAMSSLLVVCDDQLLTNKLMATSELRAFLQCVIPDCALALIPFCLKQKGINLKSKPLYKPDNNHGTILFCIKIKQVLEGTFSDFLLSDNKVVRCNLFHSRNKQR